MNTWLTWWRNGYIYRAYAAQRQETGVALITLFRTATLAMTVTEIGGVHISVSLRLFWMEASIGFALWDKGVQ